MEIQREDMLSKDYYDNDNFEADSFSGRKSVRVYGGVTDNLPDYIEYTDSYGNDYFLKKSRKKLGAYVKKHKKKILKGALTIGALAAGGLAGGKVAKLISKGKDKAASLKASKRGGLFSKLKKVRNKIKSGASTKAVEYASLRPIDPVIITALKAKGFNPPPSREARAQLFYNEIVAKSGTSERPIDFDNQDQYERDNIEPTVVESVVSFVADMIRRKKSGEKLSPTLEKAGNIAVNVSKQLSSRASNSDMQDNTVSNMKGAEDIQDASMNSNSSVSGISLKSPIVIAVIVGVLALVFLRK
jgi:hypothetical protein